MTCMDKLGRTCLLKVERNGYASKGKINATGRMYQFSSSLSTYNMYKTMVSRFSLKCFISPDVNFKLLVQYKYCTIQVPQYIITSNIHNQHVRQFFLHSDHYVLNLSYMLIFCISNTFRKKRNIAQGCNNLKCFGSHGILNISAFVYPTCLQKA